MAKWIQTLGDAREIGQELIAVCDNPICRFKRLLDLDAIIQHAGELHPLIPARGSVHYSERLRCPKCHHRGAFIWIGEPKTPEPLFNGFNSHVRLYGPGDELLNIIARTANTDVGKAAYVATVKAYPGRRVMFLEGARIVADSRFPVIEGGKKWNG